MNALRKDLKKVISFIENIKTHTRRLKAYSQWDPYVAKKYTKELNGFKIQSQEILSELNDHDSVINLKKELEDVMKEFELVVEESNNKFI